MISTPFFRNLGLAAVLSVAAGAALAADGVFAEGAGGVQITLDDITADAQRIPAGQRYQALSKPDAVQQAAQNLYIRRVLAQEAVRDGLDKDPLVIATLRLVRERVLSDARLAKIDEAARPTDAAIEAAARANYNAAPEKYRTATQTRVRHILLMGNTEKGQQVAEQVLAEIKAGADFEKVAMERSQDGSAARGGDLGWFEPGRMVPEFQDAVDQLKNPGDVSGLVRTQFGWHIIKLEGRRPGGQRTYEEVRDELRAMAVNQLQSDARLREARRIAEGFKPDRKVIEAFSAAQKP
ncbi:peptidylprolyl isomerase [Ramlibacter sp.]|uniref:peptidylprolyl isomerase n=1 Tax=Ramlibacter sp. TaxID=1917967 RepID=UPI0035B44883